jgi:hypothetical protein
MARINNKEGMTLRRCTGCDVCWLSAADLAMLLSAVEMMRGNQNTTNSSHLPVFTPSLSSFSPLPSSSLLRPRNNNYHESHSSEKENKIQNRQHVTTSLSLEGQEEESPLFHQTLLTPTSYRGGYLFLLLSHNHFSKHLKIQSIHAATSTHLALSLQHLTSQRYCLLILDLVPTHIPTPSYVEIKRFLIRFCNGSNPKLNHTLVYYPNSLLITVQFITPSTETKLGTALMIGTQLGVVQFFSFQLLEWEWKAIESFDILQTQDQILLGRGHKYLQALTYHPPTLTLTWIELDDRNNCSLIRCCKLPSSLCPHVAIDPSDADSLRDVNPYRPENFISTLYQIKNRSIQFCHLVPSPPSPTSAVASWLISTQFPEIIQPQIIATPDSPASSSSSFSVMSSSLSSQRSFLETQLNELKLFQSETEEGFNVTVIDYSKSRLTPTMIPFPSLDEEYSLVGLTSTTLPFGYRGESNDLTEGCLVIVQLEIHSTKERKCFLYLLEYSISGSIQHFSPFPLQYSSPDLLSSCSLLDNTLFVLHKSSSPATAAGAAPEKRQKTSLFYSSLGPLLTSLCYPSLTSAGSGRRWFQYHPPLTSVSLRGELLGLVHSQPDPEWMMEVKRYYCQQLFKTCLYTTSGELLEMKGKFSTTISLPKPSSPSTSSTSKYSLREITEKLFLTNSLVNPTAPTLSELIGTTSSPLYHPHSWWCHQSLPVASLPGKEDHRKESFMNSVFIYSNAGVIPPHSTLCELWKHQVDLELIRIEIKSQSTISESSSSPFPSSLRDELLLDHLLSTLFASDASLLCSCVTDHGHHPHSPLANYFIDIDYLPLKERSPTEVSPSSPIVFSVRYLDLQELFISCQRETVSLPSSEGTVGDEEKEGVMEEESYFELALWYLRSFQPSSLVNFVYEILVLLSSRPRPGHHKLCSSISPYDSLGKLNRHQRLVLLRSFASLESPLPCQARVRMEEGGLSSSPQPSSLLPEQQLYLMLCSFAHDGALRIVQTLCQWNCWHLAVNFSCRIFTEYNTPRVRSLLGERWNNFSLDEQPQWQEQEQQEEFMRWDNPFDDLDESPQGGEAAEEEEEEEVNPGEGEGGDGDWGNTWKDASGSETTESKPQEDQGADDCVSQIGDWNDVESDDEEESDHICWKNFAKYSRSLFLFCLKSLLLSGEVRLGCKLISCRPQCHPSCVPLILGHHGDGRSDQARGISELDIILVFEEIYEQQQQQQQQQGQDPIPVPGVLTSDDLRSCVDSLTYSHCEVDEKLPLQHQSELCDSGSQTGG